jgi:hypothetical protein
MTTLTIDTDVSILRASRPLQPATVKSAKIESQILNRCRSLAYDKDCFPENFVRGVLTLDIIKTQYANYIASVQVEPAAYDQLIQNAFDRRVNVAIGKQIN